MPDVTVMRACNGCDRILRPANDAELNAAMFFSPLPDVRDECGCAARGDACPDCGYPERDKHGCFAARGDGSHAE